MLKPPLQPMLLKSKEKPFNSKDYLFELKWDGYRCLIFIDNNNIYIQSRNKKNLTHYFSELKNIYKQLNTDHAVIDGEICYLDEKGKPIFNKLQGRISGKSNNIKYPVTFITWDLLSYNQTNIYNLPLFDRKQIIENILSENNRILLSKYIKTKGKELFKQAQNAGMEGIVAKKIDSPYEFKRSKYWLKIKSWKYTNTVIGGYTRDKTGLIVGKQIDLNNTVKLQYMGKIKLAISKEMQTALFKFLPTIKIDISPFEEIRGETPEINWVKPVIKCKVRYTEITKHNSFRHGYAEQILI